MLEKATALEEKMREAGYTLSALAKALGMSRSTIYRKLYGEQEFTLSEIRRIMELLKLETPMGIFFEQKG